MADMILFLETKSYPQKLKIYKCDDQYALVEKSRFYKKCYNNGRKVDREYRQETFIFESDIDKGIKYRVEICKWNCDTTWSYRLYINKTAFKYMDDDEWTQQTSDGCIEIINNL